VTDVNTKALINRLKKAEISSVALWGLWGILLITMYSLNPSQFGTLANFRNVSIQLAENACFATAYFLVFVCGGFNFACVTIGNIASIALAVVCANKYLNSVMSPTALLCFGILIALLTGIACGAFISFFIFRFKLAHIMVTICAGRMFEGVGFILTKGASVLAPRALIQIGAIYFFDAVPLLLLVAISCFFICGIFLNMTRFGKQAKLYGINRIANRYSGISNPKTLIVVYSLSGFLSALGGLVVMAKLGSARPDYGTSLTPTIILTVMMSGLIMGSGRIKVLNVFIACLCMQILSNGMNLGGVNAFITSFINGFMLLGVIIVTTKSYKKLKIFQPRKRAAAKHDGTKGTE
jgi:ribose/xylose/arabinose/galactoside ABC-type transport system permease subunit